MVELVESQVHWKRRLTCGQMAKANCVTEKTLRFYQKKDILEPEFVDKTTGFRYYGIVQSTKLDMITHLQSMGFSLDEIKAINDAHDIAFLRDEAQLRLQRIRDQRRELELAEKLAVDLIDDCDSYLNMPLCNQPMLERLPDRYILEFDVMEPPAQERDADLTASDLWEWSLRAVKQTIVANGWPLDLFRNVGFLADRDRLGDADMWLERLFVFVDESFGACFEQAQLLPGGLHVAYYIDTGYGAEGQAEDVQRFADMETFARQNGLAVAGDSYCEAISRFQRFFNTSLDSFSRYCMPVRSARS